MIAKKNMFRLEFLCKSDDGQFVEPRAIWKLSNKHHRKIYRNFLNSKEIQLESLYICITAMRELLFFCILPQYPYNPMTKVFSLIFDTRLCYNSKEYQHLEFFVLVTIKILHHLNLYFRSSTIFPLQRIRVIINWYIWVMVLPRCVLDRQDFE